MRAPATALKFTPLEFETVCDTTQLFWDVVKIYSVGV